MLKRLIERLQNVWRAEPSAPSPYQEAVTALEQMLPMDAGVYQDIRRIEVIQPTLDRYLTLITQAITALEQDQLFRPPTMTLESIRIHDFFLSSDGCYVQVDEDASVFVQAASELLLLYERRNQEPNQSGLLQANLYRILPVINNLISLSETHLTS